MYGRRPSTSRSWPPATSRLVTLALSPAWPHLTSYLAIGPLGAEGGRHDRRALLFVTTAGRREGGVEGAEGLVRTVTGRLGRPRPTLGSWRATVTV